MGIAARSKSKINWEYFRVGFPSFHYLKKHAFFSFPNCLSKIDDFALGMFSFSIGQKLFCKKKKKLENHYFKKQTLAKIMCSFPISWKKSILKYFLIPVKLSFIYCFLIQTICKDKKPTLLSICKMTRIFNKIIIHIYNRC